MGRSGGGGFGGGGFSGGFSGGGRMSGGFSGGLGFGGGRSSMPSMGGSGYSGGPIYVGGGGFGGNGFLGGLILGQLLSESRGSSYQPPPNGQPVDPQGYRPAQGPSAGGSCLIPAIIFIAIAIFTFTIFMILGSGGCSSNLSGGSEHASTIERTPLSSDLVIETPYFTDDDGDWIGEPQVLETGMREFYMETGVQPYLHILPNGSQSTVNALTTIAENEYDTLFQDEAHFLVVFCDNNQGGFGVGYSIGSAAKTVMDSEAISIFQDYLDRYYSDYTITESEMFADTYTSTAERIMTTDAERNKPIIIALIVGIVIAIIVVGIILIVRRRAKTREAELRHQQEVLNTPLEKFGDDEVEETARKYAQDRAAVEGAPNTDVANSTDPRDYEKFGDDDLEDLERKYSSNSTNQQQ